MIEAIIGRQHGTNCLLMTIQGKGYVLSDKGTVPNTVSSSHCRLVVDDNGVWTLSNIKSELDTFVDGLQIDSRQITPQSRVDLGINHFVVDMQKVQAVVNKIMPPVFSLRPLEQIWDEYDKGRMALQLAEQRRNNWRAGGGVLSLLGILVMFIPIPALGKIRFVFTGASFLVALYFFVRGFNSSNSLPMKLKKLNEDFESKYLCPNPDCPRFMGPRPYKQLQFDKGCPHCQCKYTNI